MTDQQPITREQVEQVFREKTGFSYDTCHRYATAVMPLIEQQQQEISDLRMKERQHTLWSHILGDLCDCLSSMGYPVPDDQDDPNPYRTAVERLWEANQQLVGVAGTLALERDVQAQRVAELEQENKRLRERFWFVSPLAQQEQPND